jgi:hypothetical protein
MWGGTLDIKDTLPPFYENPKGWTLGHWKDSDFHHTK